MHNDFLRLFSSLRKPKRSEIRPRPHVSQDFCIRKFFYADIPSVHTCPPYTLGVSRDFFIRSPEWKFLYTLCIRIRVDACIRIFLYALTSQHQNQSRRLSFLCNAHALLTNPLRCPDTCGWSYTIRIRYVWTQIFLYPHKKICEYKNLRIRVNGLRHIHCSQKAYSALRFTPKQLILSILSFAAILTSTSLTSSIFASSLCPS